MSSSRPHVVLFTDLDGTLLSRDTYDADPAQEALGICRDAGIPVVFVSSKTRAEMEAVRKRLANRDPFISENGGGIYLPREGWEEPPGFEESGDFWVCALGAPHAAVVRILHAAAGECGLRVEGFSSMSHARISELTGLPVEEAVLAGQREFDEPFLIRDPREPALSCLHDAIRKAGLNLTRGGRFFHIMGKCDKGEAVRRVMDLYRERHPGVRFAAAGDAENDLPMLRQVDHPFLVRRPDGGFNQAAVFDRVTVTQGIGPEGFCEAVQTLPNRP